MKILVLDKEFDSAITIRNTIVKSVVVGSVLTLRCLRQLYSNCMLCTIEHEKANTCSVDECPVLSGILRQNYPEISRYLNKAAATLDRTAFPHRVAFSIYNTAQVAERPHLEDIFLIGPQQNKFLLDPLLISCLFRCSAYKIDGICKILSLWLFWAKDTCGYT